jgi:hypothetical protein
MLEISASLGKKNFFGMPPPGTGRERMVVGRRVIGKKSVGLIG